MENRAKQSDLDAIEALVDGIENGWNRGDAGAIFSTVCRGRGIHQRDGDGLLRTRVI